jgi:hypothetical protein
MREFPAPAPIHATIRIAAGDVRIIAEARDTVTVDVTPGARGEAAQHAADNTRVEMSGSGLVIETPQARGFIIRRTPPVNIAVRVPLDSALLGRAASADFYCDGRFGSSDINSASGDLRIEYIAGDLSRHAASGDTQFGRIDGSATINTASGDVRGDSIGGDFSSKTASGDVNIEAIAGSARCTTASGDVTLGCLASGETRVHSASGDVTVGVAEGTGLWMDLSSASGDTRSEMPVGDGSVLPGGPSLRVHVRTASGDIKVQRSRTAPAAPVPAGYVPTEFADEPSDSDPVD